MITIEFINTEDHSIVHYLVHTLTNEAFRCRKIISVSKQNQNQNQNQNLFFDKIEII